MKTRSTLASRSLKGWDTMLTTVKWPIDGNQCYFVCNNDSN